MLGIINATTRASGSFQDSTKAYYAAAAGIEAVMGDLISGDDALDAGYTPPSVRVNGIDVIISITSPQVDLPPKATFRYLDPGASQGLASLGSGETWSVKLNGVAPFSSLFVNWSFVTGDVPDLRIRVLDAGGSKIADANEPLKKNTPATLVTQLGSGDTYTVEFGNQDVGPIPSDDFSAKGRQNKTWIYVKATGNEYLITSTAGNVTLRAYVRQLPGPGQTSTPLKQTVVVESWQGPIPP